jgi:DNA-binding LacI/PurR family transcriptional regulator
MDDRSLNATDWLRPSKQQTRPRRPDARATVGFLTGNIHVGASRRLWRGVVDAAEQHAVNLLCFPGGGLRASNEFETQRNVIYDLVNPAHLNGLVSWASTITGSLEPADVMAFHHRYRSLPLVSLVQPVERIPTVSVDSYQGMRAAIVHLIDVHNYRRLAFIRGPSGHYYAQERYRAYLDVLQEHGLPVVPELISEPMHWEAGTEAIQLLLDEVGLRPGVDVQAVVAVSDLLALGALKALQARGIQVPRDLAIIGFNDSTEGRLAAPPLTSVTMPFYEQGARAVDTLLAQCGGENIPAQVMLQSQLVVRQSCGCPARAVARAATGPIEARFEDLVAMLPELRQTLLAEMAQMPGDSRDISQDLEQILDALHADLSSGPRGRFVSALEHALDAVIEVGGDVAAWQDIVSTLRRSMLPYLDRWARHQAEDLIGQARVLVGEVAQRAQG